MKRFLNAHKKAVGAAITVAIVASSGIAYATWTSPNGTGNGHATGYQSVAANITSQSTNPNTSDATDLFPTSSVTNTITVTNNNPYPVEVVSISAGSSNIAGGCTAGSVTSASQAGTHASPIVQSDAVTTTIAKDGGTGTYNVVYTMGAGAPDACQGAAFVLPLTIGTESSGF